METEQMKEPPKSRSYERPGEFINAWARLSAGDEVPAPTAQLPDNTPITQDLANLKEFIQAGYRYAEEQTGERWCEDTGQHTSMTRALNEYLRTQHHVQNYLHPIHRRLQTLIPSLFRRRIRYDENGRGISLSSCWGRRPLPWMLDDRVPPSFGLRLTLHLAMPRCTYSTACGMSITSLIQLHEGIFLDGLADPLAFYCAYKAYGYADGHHQVRGSIAKTIKAEGRRRMDIYDEHEATKVAIDSIIDGGLS